MPYFILFIREDLSKYPLPDLALQKLINAHTEWAKELASRGIFRSGYGVADQGKLVEKKGGKIMENPLRNVNEGIGGFYIIEVADFESAVAIAAECPTFDDGDFMEVRPLM